MESIVFPVVVLNLVGIGCIAAIALGSSKPRGMRRIAEIGYTEQTNDGDDDGDGAIAVDGNDAPPVSKSPSPSPLASTARKAPPSAGTEVTRAAKAAGVAGVAGVAGAGTTGAGTTGTGKAGVDAGGATTCSKKKTYMYREDKWDKEHMMMVYTCEGGGDAKLELNMTLLSMNAGNVGELAKTVCAAYEDCDMDDYDLRDRPVWLHGTRGTDVRTPFGGVIVRAFIGLLKDAFVVQVRVARDPNLEVVKSCVKEFVALYAAGLKGTAKPEKRDGHFTAIECHVPCDFDDSDEVREVMEGILKLKAMQDIMPARAQIDKEKAGKAGRKAKATKTTTTEPTTILFSNLPASSAPVADAKRVSKAVLGLEPGYVTLMSQDTVRDASLVKTLVNGYSTSKHGDPIMLAHARAKDKVVRHVAVLSSSGWKVFNKRAPKR